jgi:endonuclease/exonuclease/phosphatase family metal-dependent hydrolase
MPEPRTFVDKSMYARITTARWRQFLSLAILGVAFFTETSKAQTMSETIRVMSFNLWHGGDAGQQPLQRTVEVIRQSRADIVGLQETAGVAPEGQPRPDRAADIAKRLGWSYVDQGERTGVISRFEIVGTTPRKWGVKLNLPSGRQVYLLNVHFAHAPYQPYQLLDIPYENAPFLNSAEQAVAAAQAARGEQVRRCLAEVKSAAAEGLTMFLTGDFNEPSHRDWTTAAAAAKQCPLCVEWPSTKAVEDAGFVDVFRNVYPDPVKSPGRTWTPTTRLTDPKDRHDRIDFVFMHGTDARIKSIEIVGESAEFADIVVTPYPSDHRAVVADVELAESGP